MRKTILGMLAVVAVAFMAVSPANAGSKRHHHHHHLSKPVVAGAIVGTIVGFGLYEGWYGNSAILAGSTGGAVAGGIIAGVATATMIHAVTTPCAGFHAILGGKNCKNGKYVGKYKYRHAHLFW